MMASIWGGSKSYEIEVNITVLAFELELGHPAKENKNKTIKPPWTWRLVGT